MCTVRAAVAVAEMQEKKQKMEVDKLTIKNNTWNILNDESFVPAT